MEQAIAKAERQRREQAIILAKAEILVNAVQHEQQRLMGMHHSFRFARGARGVEQRS